MKRAGFIIFFLLLIPMQAQTTETIRADFLSGAHRIRHVPDFSFPASPSKAVVIDQMPGWPKYVNIHPTFADTCGYVMADIDGDGRQEIIVATSEQQLFAWDPYGTTLFSADLTGLAQTVPAVGNVTGNPDPEIVVTTRDASGGSPTPTLHVFSGSGSLLHSRTGDHGGSMDSPPTLADFDGDGKMEILFGERGSGAGWLYLLNVDEKESRKGWPVPLDHVPATSAAVGDLDGDGDLEITVCSYLSLYAIEADGTVMDGFPVTFSGETYSYGSPALADLDGDGKLEILTTTHSDYNRVHAIQYDGAELAGWPYDLGDAWTYCPPSVGDIDDDGDLEVVAGNSGGTVADYALHAIHHDGAPVDNFPYLMPGGVEGHIALADIAGDAELEILFTNNLQDAGQGYLFAIDASANLLDGWPLRPEGFTYLHGVTVGDVDGDGTVEIGSMGNKSDNTASVNLYTYDGYAFGEGGVHWRTYQAGNKHTGLYDPGATDDDDDDSITDDDDDDDNDDDGENDDTCCWPDEPEENTGCCG